MDNRIFKFGVAAITMLSSIHSSAYDFEADGIYYNITSMSNLEVGVTHRTGTTRNSSYTGEIVIPETVNYNNRTFTVTSIENFAMGGSSEGSEITHVVLPETIMKIGADAFYRCSTLENINFPVNLVQIDKYAFHKTSISEAILGNKLQIIGEYAFDTCSKLNKVVIGKNVTSIGSRAFSNCSSLWEVFFLTPTKPTGLNNYTFYNCHSGLEIYVPSESAYGLGKEYISFTDNDYIYSGKSHDIEWTNNLKAYKCTITEEEGKTEINAGEYTKNLKAVYSDGIDITVEIPYTYTIEKAPLTLTVTNMQREYGEANPSFSSSIEGFVNGENEQTIGATPIYECTATTKSNVGDYRILATLDAPNYNVTYKYGTLSVTQAPLLASVANATKIYGNANPAFTLSYSGLKNGETEPAWSVKPKFATLANQLSGVGEYVVTAADGVSSNYNVTAYNPGTLTVTKRDLTVKVSDCERLYGEVNPEFKISYSGFVNGDNESSLITKPTAECRAAKESDAGKYAISLTGGSSDNYNFIYQDGTLTVNPMTVGFKNTYNTVTFNDMSISSDSRYFNFIPEIVGPYDPDDFWLELWFMDKDSKYGNYVTTITSGEYAGKYVNTNSDRMMNAGKYIFNLKSKGTNPNVTANPAKAYVTVNRASTNLEWDNDSPITVEVGDKIDLGITYQADLWCSFNTDYDEDVIELTSEGATGNNPHWYATGLKEGETTLYFNITCRKNDMGFYDFSDSRTVSKRIKVEAKSSGIEDVDDDNANIRVSVVNHIVIIENKPTNAKVAVYNLQGTLVRETIDSTIDNLSNGIYILNVNGRTFKIAL